MHYFISAAITASLSCSPLALGVDVLPGDIQTMLGSTTLEELDLVGAPVFQAQHIFEIHNADQVLLAWGNVEVEVVHAALPDAMLFKVRVYDTAGGVAGEIREIRWTGFSGTTTNCNWLNNADRGDVAAMRAGRTWDGDTITFGYNWWFHNTGEEVLSMIAGEDSSSHFILSDAPAFKADEAELTIELMSGESWSVSVPGPELNEPADFNGNGAVDGGDLGLLISEWGVANSFADLNGDGIVDGGDMGILLAYWD